MTVKAFTDEQKANIGRQYQAKEMNQKQLAAAYQTSERTINRVLNELGLLTAVPRLKGEAHLALQVLKEFNLTPETLREMMHTGDVSPDERQRLWTRINRAERALLRAGYEDMGGEEWRPPVVAPMDMHTSTAPGGVWIDANGRAFARVSDEQIEVVLEEALADVRVRSGLAKEPSHDELRPQAQQPTGQPWRVSEHHNLFGNAKMLVLSVGSDEIKTRAADRNFIRWVAGSNLTSKQVTREQVVQFCMDVPEEQWAPILNQIVTARVAKASNVHTQTAMLNFQQAVEHSANKG